MGGERARPPRTQYLLKTLSSSVPDGGTIIFARRESVRNVRDKNLTGLFFCFVRRNYILHIGIFYMHARIVCLAMYKFGRLERHRIKSVFFFSRCHVCVTVGKKFRCPQVAVSQTPFNVTLHSKYYVNMMVK